MEQSETHHRSCPRESGTEIDLLEFDFVVPTPAQLSRAVKVDEISAVEPTNHCVLLDNQNTERLDLLSQPLYQSLCYLTTPVAV